jgi:catechol 2,3-dioxygenase-like lactoylglutathione lyase family enzyme
MPVVFDHVAVPSRDPEASARFLGQILGAAIERDGPEDEFVCLRLADRVQILFAAATEVARHHLAFRVTADEFESVVQRLRAAGLPIGNDPEAPANGQTSDPLGGRGRVYFSDPDGHLFEVCA